MRAETRALLIAAPLALAAAACQKPEAPPPADTAAKAAIPATPKLDRLERRDFNRLAVLVGAPLFWRSDANGDKAVDPAEVAILHGFGDGARTAWVGADGFTAKFFTTYQAMMKMQAQGPTLPADAKERARRLKVIEELNQGSPTLVESSFEGASPEDRAIVEHVLQASLLIEQLYARQTGAAGLDAKIPADDPAGRALFYRNQGPWCVAPKTEGDPACNASPDFPPRISGLYPADLQQEGFCDALAKRKDAEQLMHQFVVVSGSGDALKAVPYSEAYKAEMEQVRARSSTAAAASIQRSGGGPLQGLPRGGGAGLPRQRLAPRRRGVVEDERQQLEVVPAHRAGRGVLRALQPERPASTSASRASTRTRSSGRRSSTPEGRPGARARGAGRASRTRRGRSRSTSPTSSTSSSTRVTRARATARPSARASRTGARWPTRAGAAPWP
jgi:hypothetical protein